MSNQELAKIFYKIADFLKMEEVAFKPYAYQKAAIVLEGLEKNVQEIYKEGGIKALEKIPGVGESIAEKIEEYLKTGRIKYYQKLKKKTPINIEELTAIQGLGSKMVRILYQKLGIRNLNDLEKAAKTHKIACLHDFGEKTEKNILEGIAFFKKSKGRFLLGDILQEVKEILEQLGRLKEIKQISVAGSVRRRKETIGDVDILAAPHHFSKKAVKAVMDFFVSLPEVIKIWGKGPTKSSVRLKQGFDVDLRLVAKKSYGSALQYFTGSKEHNIITRRIAIEKGLKLNEYGVFRNKKMIAGWNESGVYRAIGLSWMPPELRENQGEIEAAKTQVQARPNGLPKLVELKDIKGDLHCHSNWDGGENSILEMVETALKMGYGYLGISDHTKFLRIEQGLNEKQLTQQRKEIDEINVKFQTQPRLSELSDVSNVKFKVLQGAETNILDDGSLDIKDQALKKLDYVNAGVHSNFKMSKEKMTERIIKAMKNPYVKILVHPTGRILKKREGFQMDLEKIFRAAKEYDIILEVNSFPQRLDLNDKNVRLAKEMGIKIAINSDAHHYDQLKYMKFGIYQARRGWCEKKDIINAQPLNKLLKIFQK